MVGGVRENAAWGGEAGDMGYGGGGVEVASVWVEVGRVVGGVDGVFGREGGEGEVCLLEVEV